MTAFVPANLPTSVNTLEKLAVWALGALYQLHKNDRYQESDSAPVIPVITAQDGLAADKKEHIIFRPSFELSDDWRSQPTKLWEEVQEFPGNTPIPASFLP
ncbi:hypothetical protein H6F75_22465 [Nodosilinea sp. FACHB-131]|uniref:hypothetical protein n=1 Tax=Cyanophyceae TaxID=3028117 RepID=UPI0016866E95|nr:hypothetical protein [Nodosilinea sp. FACHB-131]MBD1876254.1 hypothetical protein [Nodosilinea sp. FACHB-131]